MAIKISLVSDVADAVSGGEKVADSFDKVVDSLDDVVKEARKAEDAVEEVGDGSKKAEDASDDMAKKFRTDMDKVRKDAKDTGDGIGKGLKDGTDKAGAGMDDLKGEANDTAREVGASFDGSAESIAEGFQEVAANAFAGFGPAGAAAGLAAAAGIGIAISKLTEYAEKVNEAKVSGAEWAQEFNLSPIQDRIDVLRDQFSELSTTIVDDRQWWELWQADAVSALDAVVDAQDKAGASTADFMRVFNELDPEARLSGMEAYRDELEKQRDALDRSNQAATDRLDIPEAQAYGEKRDAIDGLLGVLETEIDKQEVANDVEKASADAIKGTAQELVQKNEAIEESNKLLEDNADANRSAFTAELDLAEQLAETSATMKDSEATTADKKRALADLADQIVSTASAEEDAKGTTEAYNSVLAEQRAAFEKAAEAAGYTESEASKLFDTLIGGPKKKEIDVTDNGSAKATQSRINGIQGGTVAVDVQVSQASINAVYNTVAGIRLPAIQVQAKYGQAAL